MKFILKRYETEVGHKSILVGFDVTTSSGHTRYFETSVPLVEGKNFSENEVCLIAYKALKPQLVTWEESLKGKTALIGREFIPPEE